MYFVCKMNVVHFQVVDDGFAKDGTSNCCSILVVCSTKCFIGGKLFVVLQVICQAKRFCVYHAVIWTGYNSEQQSCHCMTDYH